MPRPIPQSAVRGDRVVVYAQEAEKHKEIADWYRIMAGSVAVPSLRDRYLELAAAYDRLADTELELASLSERS